MGKTQKETNPTVAGQRKQIKGCEAEQLRMDKISNGLILQTTTCAENVVSDDFFNSMKSCQKIKKAEIKRCSKF